MKLLAVLFSAAVLTGTVHAVPPRTEQAFLALPKAQQEAEATDVMKAPTASRDIWALGGVGVAGARPLKFLAYEALLRRRDAAALFAELLKSADPHAQLYALKGLSVCAPATFKKIAPAYLDRAETILRGQGCVLTSVAFGQIVREMQPPVVKLTPTPARTSKTKTP